MSARGFDFGGKRVLLTGASKGLGRALVAALVARGASVIAVARDAEALGLLAAAHPAKVVAMPADLSDPAEAAALAARVSEAHPDCAALINNAGALTYRRFTDQPPLPAETIARDVSLNLAAPLILVSALMPLFSRRDNALIANVTSGLALSPTAESGLYSATKAGLSMFTRSLGYQVEDAHPGLQVSEVLMTLVETEMAHESKQKPMPVAEAVEQMLMGLEQGRARVPVGPIKALMAIHNVSRPLADWLVRKNA